MARRLFVGLLVLALAVLALRLTGDIWTYGTPGQTLNGGVAIRVADRCAGFEVWGTPGPWGGSNADCDF